MFFVSCISEYLGHFLTKNAEIANTVGVERIYSIHEDRALIAKLFQFFGHRRADTLLIITSKWVFFRSFALLTEKINSELFVQVNKVGDYWYS